MSPQFADITKALVFNLTEPITLQLGTVGSWSKINFGTLVDVNIAGIAPRETTIEIIDEDVESGRTLNALPDNFPGIMLSKDEYSAITGDEVVGEAPPQLKNRNDKRKNKRRESDRQYHSEQKMPEKLGNSNRSLNDPNGISDASHKAEPKYSHYEPTEECEPTSSKVLVEDLITDADDKAHEHDFHIDMEIPRPGPTRIQFWDRPRPTPDFAWPGDVRMPDEWNGMIGDMWEIDPNSKRTLFHYPDVPINDDPERDINDRLLFIVPSSTIKSNGPHEFTRRLYPDTRHREFIRRSMVVEPNEGKDDFENRISKMIESNERRNTRKITRDSSATDRAACTREKGKQKASEEDTEEDIERLRQHWYEEYEELLQGVPSKMPPWQAVNHEIPLVDSNVPTLFEANLMRKLGDTPTLVGGK
ncbi:hypothetical protein ARMGADRAFT_1030433 [Armillaria gallica]|uniref:Uncharacterized protein n=1 Tax=Armillaria gallica TaxID=47427 RepID=A0A2H3DNC0_ARMGA|nr:hypothetical protein ARMGADRAFT_1030433 [Armillaria gallica]